MTLVKEKNRSKEVKTRNSRIKTQEVRRSQGPPYDLCNIPYKEIIRAILNDFPPDLVFIWYMGSLNDDNVDFSLPFSSYRDKHFFFPTLHRLSNLKIGRELNNQRR